MEQKQKNRKKVILVASMLAVLGVSTIGGVAFAKYVTKIEGEGSMKVAKWNPSINEIELSNTHYTAETLTEDRIAPGTKGSFDVVINGGGTETGIDYTVKIKNIQNKPTNLYFKVDGVKCETVEGAIAACTGHIDQKDTNQVVTKTVEWVWDYETGTTEEEKDTNDEIDTEEGKLAQTMSFDVEVKAVQSRPVEA